jgi:glucose-1-phosphate cytidylyltransferase
MVPIGGQPILWHIMKGYAAQGVTRFILCLGFKREAFVDYFLSFRARSVDTTVSLGPGGGVTYHPNELQWDDHWTVTLADTGEETMTGARVALASRYLEAGIDDFFLTYGDGVADIDVLSLLDFHRREGKCLTVSAVHPAGRFGEIELEGSRVASFHEKRQTGSGWINGGFMVASRRFVERYLTTDPDLILEQVPMRSAATDGELAAFEHPGFWQCMDTPREHDLLNQLWRSGDAPWARRWFRAKKLSRGCGS